MGNQNTAAVILTGTKGSGFCSAAIATAARIAAALLAVTSAATPAAAHIKCVGGFQVVQGNLLATPYCQDEIVARVAREYGVRTSPAQIRNNPNHKRHVCRLIGRDLRVQESCLTVNPGGRARSF